MVLHREIVIVQQPAKYRYLLSQLKSPHDWNSYCLEDFLDCRGCHAPSEMQVAMIDRHTYSVAVITNDIYTKEDALNSKLPAGSP